MQEGKKMGKHIVSIDPGSYLAWPDLELTSSGELICIFTACTHHGDRSFSQLRTAVSSDRGHTWKPARPFSEQCTPDTGYYYNNATIRQLRDGRLVVLTDRIYGKNDEAESHIVLYNSFDGGKTWDGGRETPARGIVPDKLVETATGRWLVTSGYFDPETNKLATRLWYSDDKGKSWNGPVIVARDPEKNLSEASILEVSGRLVCFLRENSALGLPAYLCFSEDDGLTWSVSKPFPLPGAHRPKAGLLADGRILITYRFWQGGKFYWGCWQNLFAGITDVNSVFASDYLDCSTRIIPIEFDASEVSDTGYSGWVQFPDGNLYVINYIVEDAGKAFIKGYSLPLSFLEAVPKVKKHNKGKISEKKSLVKANAV